MLRIISAIFEFIGAAILVSLALFVGLILFVLVLITMPFVAWLSRGKRAAIYSRWYKQAETTQDGVTTVEGEYREVVQTPAIAEHKTPDSAAAAGGER